MMAEFFLNTLAISLVVGVVIALLLIFNPVVDKRLPAGWKYWLWMLVALRLVLPFSLPWPDMLGPSVTNPPLLITIPVSAAHTPAGLAELNISAEAPRSETLTATQAIASDSPAMPAKPLNLTGVEIAAIIWLLGSLIILLYQLASYYLFKKQSLRWSYMLTEGSIYTVLAELSADMGIKKSISLRISSYISSPMMIGFIRPVLLLPREDYTAGEIRFILKHELVHFKRGDLWYKLLLQVARALHWFNPLVGLMTNRANTDLELYCDDAVVAGSSSEERRRYIAAILAAMQPPPYRHTSLSTHFYCGVKGMEKRFQNILHTVPLKRGGTILVAVIVAMLLMSGMIACGNDNARLSNPAADKPGQVVPGTEPQVMYASPRVPARIVIDAAHGGDDYGAVHSTLGENSETGPIYEKDYTLAIAQSLQQHLQAAGAEVIMTRSTDERVSLEERLAIINSAQADFAISLHMQYALETDAVKGSFCYYNAATMPERFQKTTAEAAELLQAAMVEGLSTQDNEVRQLNQLTLLEQSTIPVFECIPATLSGAADQKLVEQVQNFAEISSISLYQGLSRITQVPPVTIADFAVQWSNAFHSQDGAAIHNLCRDEESYLTVGSIADNGAYVLGMSSPWPWYNDQVIVINNAESFEVYYYYRTSDPHIFVERQNVRCQQVNGQLKAAEVTGQSFYSIDSLAKFAEAYRYAWPDYSFYAKSAESKTGEANNDIFETFSDPLSAAVWQLNIENAQAELADTAGSGQAAVNFTWPDGGAVTVQLSQYPSGVWVVEKELAL